MGGRGMRKICMSLRIFGINTLHLLKAFRLWMEYELHSDVFGLQIGYGLVPSDWLCGGLLGLRTQGSSWDLVLPSDPTHHRSLLHSDTSGQNIRTSKGHRDGGGQREEEKQKR